MLSFLLLVACTIQPWPEWPTFSDDTGHDSGHVTDSGTDTGSMDSGGTDDGGDSGVMVVDEDGDGYDADEDCNDGDASIHPGADEICDEVDNNCDGNVDMDAVDQSTWYRDVDEDGYGDDTIVTMSCAQPEGFVATGNDCDDGDAQYHPGADESDCTDPNDYNCDGSVGAVDGDADGYFACEECDDMNADVHPGADERCDAVDWNCDGDAELYAVDASVWYQDADEDGYGDALSTVDACDVPDGYVADMTDCDDSEALIHPAAEEYCDDGIDSNCDDSDNMDAIDKSAFYTDADEDGYGDSASEAWYCPSDADEALIDDATDCNDDDATVHPAATELATVDVDEDCNGNPLRSTDIEASVLDLGYTLSDIAGVSCNGLSTVNATFVDGESCDLGDWEADYDVGTAGFVGNSTDPFAEGVYYCAMFVEAGVTSVETNILVEDADYLLVYSARDVGDADAELTASIDDLVTAPVYSGVYGSTSQIMVSSFFTGDGETHTLELSTSTDAEDDVHLDVTHINVCQFNWH